MDLQPGRAPRRDVRDFEAVNNKLEDVHIRFGAPRRDVRDFEAVKKKRLSLLS